MNFRFLSLKWAKNCHKLYWTFVHQKRSIGKLPQSFTIVFLVNHLNSLDHSVDQSFNLIAKSYFDLDRDTVSRVANALSLESDALSMSISLMKLNSTHDVIERKESVRKSLLSFPTKFVGKTSHTLRCSKNI